jgi:membrane fusion protein
LAAQSGQPLLSILPGNGKLEAELVVPSAAIGFIAPGNTVLLRYKAYPYQKFGHYPGRVTKVSRSTLNNSDLANLAGRAETGEPYYRVTVALVSQNITAYGKPELLRPGMQLEADIMGERRRLFEWVLEPIYSLKGKI